jgi:hypothetical protein
MKMTNPFSMSVPPCQVHIQFTILSYTVPGFLPVRLSGEKKLRQEYQ